MSTTLNLADCLLTQGRNLHQLGRSHDALHVLDRLTTLQELPPEVAEEAATRLAEILLRDHQYTRARRHLTAALAREPQSARLNYLMASALDLDEQGDPEQALEHYRRSLAADPDQPQCLTECGLLAVDLGQGEDGLQALRRAVELAPDDPEVVGGLVEGLRQLDRIEDARRTLRAALFRNPRHAGFQKLWSDFQFQELCEAQAAARDRIWEQRRDADEPVLLSFARLAANTARPAGRKVIRQDPASPPPPPHWPRSEFVTDRKHA
jgi:tetratricopeptide (TPR) repeat protein